MAAEATFTIPADRFPLGTVFEELPDVTVELERIIPAQDVAIPYFWVRGTDVADVESAFSEHPGVERIEFVDSVADEHLLRVEWILAYDDVLTILTDTSMALLDARGTNRNWTFEIRGDSRSDVAEFQQRCKAVDIPIRLTKLHDITPQASQPAGTLTDKQLEALVLAYERGYFASPRQTTMAEVGADLGISEQAAASRIRRGIEGVLADALPDVAPPMREDG